MTRSEGCHLPVAVVGLHGGQWYGAAAERALAGADVVIGSGRHLEAVAAGAKGEDPGPLPAVLRRVSNLVEEGRKVCVLASGDPGFFGIVRALGGSLGGDRLEVHPAPSAVSLAFARIGVHWDDALVVSAHGRPPEAALTAIEHHAKVAVMCGPACRPQDLGRALPPLSRTVTVASHLGSDQEQLWHGDIPALAEGDFDAMSVVLFRAPKPSEPVSASITWGRPEGQFQHRHGMVTKAEIRAVALGKLHLPPAGVLWDIGAGSGSVSYECWSLCPGMRIYAVECRTDDVERLTTNLAATAITVIEGRAPEALEELPDPDRVFVGGGGMAALEASLSRLRPGGQVVATFASLERAGMAGRLLGHMSQVSVSRMEPLGDSIRLAAENPVFVCWGPRP